MKRTVKKTKRVRGGETRRVATKLGDEELTQASGGGRGTGRKAGTNQQEFLVVTMKETLISG